MYAADSLYFMALFTISHLGGDKETKRERVGLRYGGEGSREVESVVARLEVLSAGFRGAGGNVADAAVDPSIISTIRRSSIWLGFLLSTQTNELLSKILFALLQLRNSLKSKLNIH